MCQSCYKNTNTRTRTHLWYKHMHPFPVNHHRGTRLYIVRQLSCHLASCHTCTCEPSVISNNAVVWSCMVATYSVQPTWMFTCVTCSCMVATHSTYPNWVCICQILFSKVNLRQGNAVGLSESVKRRFFSTMHHTSDLNEKDDRTRIQIFTELDNTSRTAIQITK